LIGCNQPAPPTKADAVSSWIKLHAIPFNTTTPDAPEQDLLPLKQIVGNASIVGLGEATHGTHEFFEMKHRVLQFLVKQMGFTTFAIEGDWDAGTQINDYLMTGKGKARDLLQLFRIWPWNTQEVLDLIEWMRSYDANPSHLQKVQFAGFDCQSVELQGFDRVIAYVKTVDRPQVASVEALYSGIRPTADWQTYSADYSNLPQQTKQLYALHAHKVYDLLKTHQTEYIRRSSQQDFALALQEARVIVQYAQLRSIDDTTQSGSLKYANQRDAFMAENVSWLYEHGGTNVKVVLWAHNGHIANDPSNPDGWKTMGTYLREQYKDHYLPVGFSFYQGTFNAFGSTNIQPFTVAAPLKKSYNYTLGSVGLPRYILDLRRVPSGPVSQWVKGPSYFWEIGAVFDPQDKNYADDYYNFGSLQQWYDVVIHFQKVTASQLLD
jgi:erythromycin esterase